jgi:hypothetical protein
MSFDDVEDFSAIMERAAPVLRQPPHEMLFDLVFRPSTVRDRGWVLIFNTILATAAPQEPRLSNSIFQLRWNAWLAADDSNLYLEPSELNIQALAVFAAHGQDLVPPSLCLNLMGQACRMVQMIKLHVPPRGLTKDSSVYASRICLFWSLFTVDKSMSLAFGHPPILHTSLYKHVELPSFQHLAKYQPHLKNEDRIGTKLVPFVELFGAFCFIQITKLAMIMGEIWDYYLAGNGDRDQRDAIMHKLDSWIEVVSQVRLVPFHSFLA